MAVINPVRAAQMGFAVIAQDVRGRKLSGRSRSWCTLEAPRLATVGETARQKVSVSGEHPSRLLLPIVPPDKH